MYFASIALLAGLASASVYGDHRFLRRQANATTTTILLGTASTTGVPQTTLTVLVTDTETITSCEPTVTSCAARGTGNIITTTEHVKKFVTICAVTDAASVSSAISASVSSSGSASTAATGSSASDVLVPMRVAASELTYTLGSGTSLSTTVITVSSTIYGTASGATNAATKDVPAASNVTEENVDNEEVEYTTITSTTTITTTITVQPTATDASGSRNSAEASNVQASVTAPAANEAAATAAAQSTAVVASQAVANDAAATGAAQSTAVVASQAVATEQATNVANAIVGNASPGSVNAGNSVTGSGEAVINGNGNGSNSCPLVAAAVSTVTITQPAVTVTMTVEPSKVSSSTTSSILFPARNGTEHERGHGRPSASGFATFRRHRGDAVSGVAQATESARRMV